MTDYDDENDDDDDSDDDDHLESIILLHSCRQTTWPVHIVYIVNDL